MKIGLMSSAIPNIAYLQTKHTVIYKYNNIMPLLMQ